jgi:hypothetical protein
MTEKVKLTEETKLFEKKKVVDPYIAGYIESIAKTNTEKITKEILEGLSKDTSDSDSYDVESGDEDSEDRPWRPSHAVFGKSTIKQSHLDNMRVRYFRDMSIMRAGGDNNVPAPEENKVVIYRSFFKAGLRFPLSKFVVEVLKIYQIFLHQITAEAIIRMGIFVWAVRSQWMEPSAKCFCNMHELLYETKATGKEQYHNNFGCYGFIARPNASHPVPTFRKRWPEAWMEEWFYVKNDLKAREDIKDVTKPLKSLGPPTVVLVRQTSDNPAGAPDHLTSLVSVFFTLPKSVSPITQILQHIGGTSMQKQLQQLILY